MACFGGHLGNMLTNVATYIGMHSNAGCGASQYKWQHFHIEYVATKKIIIATNIHIGGTNLNVNIVVHENVDIYCL